MIMKYFLTLQCLSKVTLYNKKYCSIIKNCTLRNAIKCLHIGLCTWSLNREESDVKGIEGPYYKSAQFTVISFCWHFHQKLFKFKIIINKCHHKAYLYNVRQENVMEQLLVVGDTKSCS